MEIEIREREVRTKLPCRILRLVVDAVWGTWQHLPYAIKSRSLDFASALACAMVDASLGMTIFSNRRCF